MSNDWLIPKPPRYMWLRKLLCKIIGCRLRENHLLGGQALAMEWCCRRCGWKSPQLTYLRGRFKYGRYPRHTKYLKISKPYFTRMSKWRYG